MNAKRWALALAMLGLLHTSTAYADSPAEAEATTRFEEGNTLWGQGKHEEARLKYVQAYAVLKKPGVLFNLARAEMQVGHTVEAYVRFREFLKLPQTDMDRSLMARKYLAELGKKVSLITTSPATPHGTKVVVDGKVEGEVPLVDPIAVTPGKHDVILRYADQEKKTPVSCPLQETVTVELVPNAPQAGVPPKGSGNPPPGGITPPPYTKEQGNWVPTIVLGIVGIGGLAVGGTMGALSASQDDELRSLSQTRPCTPTDAAACTALEDKSSSAKGLGTGAIVGYIGGGVFLGAAIVTAIVMKPWEYRVKETHVRLVPGIGGGALVGTF